MSLFALGAGMFMLAQVIGLVVGYMNLGLPEFAETLPVSSSVSSFLIAFLIATVLMLLMVKFIKGAVLFKIMLGAMSIIGAETVFETFMPLWPAIILAGAVVLLRFLYPKVIVQNIVMTLAIAGIGASIGLILPVGAVILILLVLSVYDYIAVFKTGHMVTLFKSLMLRNVPLSIIIPSKIKGMGKNVNEAMPGKSATGERKFMMLGTGDIAFPVIFAVSAARHSLFSGVAVLFGAFFGIIAVYSMLLDAEKGAVPALPPIAMCTISAFLISLMIELLSMKLAVII